MSETKQATPQEKVEVSVSAVLADLANSLSRKEIATKYGLNRVNMIALFKHPKLKGKKSAPKFEPAFVVKDDAPEVKEYVEKPRKPRTTATSNEAKADTEIVANADQPVTQQEEAGASKGTW